VTSTASRPVSSRPSHVYKQGQESTFQLILSLTLSHSLSSSYPLLLLYFLILLLLTHCSSSSPHSHIILTSAPPCPCCLFYTYYCLLVSSSHHRELFSVTQVNQSLGVMAATRYLIYAPVHLLAYQTIDYTAAAGAKRCSASHWRHKSYRQPE